ncbi:MAG: hypothetical protein HOO06_05805 [Bdellovibrionaceae bacterium]|jgi:hypothetical protein|nr:hypothetical protein [Pseudobdellovibrionaceae bacterium]
MKKTDKFLITLSLIIFAAAIFAVADYDRLFNRSSSKKIIARVESVSKDSLIKSPDAFEYKQLKVNDPITNGDNLFSGDESEILVKFINGPRVVIGKESTISFRQVDGQPDLKIDKGSFSGTFEEGDMLDVSTDNEVITLNGNKDTQFSISQIKNGNLEIGSFSKDLQVEHKGKKITLKNEKASISPGKGLQSNKKTSSTPVKNLATANEVSLDTPKKKKTGLVNKAPYPKSNHIFLHKTGGTIPVYPKALCKGACTLSVSLNGQQTLQKAFQRDMIPVMYLKVKPKTTAKVVWTFNDGGDDITGEFEILINNQENFQKAFDKKSPVEVMN